MSFKTTESGSHWKVITYDNQAIYLTDDEFSYFQMVIDPPKTLSEDELEYVKGVKYLIFEDGGLAISDIRRYEKVYHRQEYNLLSENSETGEPITEQDCQASIAHLKDAIKRAEARTDVPPMIQKRMVSYFQNRLTEWEDKLNRLNSPA